MSKTKIFPNFWQALLYNYILPLVIGFAILLPVIFIYYKGVIPAWLYKIYNLGHLFTIPFLLFFLWKSKVKITWSEFTHFNIGKTVIVILLAIVYEFIFFGTIALLEKLFNRDYPPFFSSFISCLALIESLILTPIVEEILYRRIFLHQFLKQYSSWLALLLSSFIFAIPHVPVIIHFELFIPYFISGLFLGLIYYKTQSVSLCIISHFIMNLITCLPI
jgi:membrane protease YdiL (CAAX protease family)